MPKCLHFRGFTIVAPNSRNWFTAPWSVSRVHTQVCRLVRVFGRTSLLAAHQALASWQHRMACTRHSEINNHGQQAHELTVKAIRFWIGFDLCCDHSGDTNHACTYCASRFLSPSVATLSPHHVERRVNCLFLFNAQSTMTLISQPDPNTKTIHRESKTL